MVPPRLTQSRPINNSSRTHGTPWWGMTIGIGMGDILFFCFNGIGGAVSCQTFTVRQSDAFAL